MLSRSCRPSVPRFSRGTIRRRASLPRLGPLSTGRRIATQPSKPTHRLTMALPLAERLRRSDCDTTHTDLVEVARPVRSPCYRSAGTIGGAWLACHWWRRDGKALAGRVSRCCREAAAPPGTPFLLLRLGPLSTRRRIATQPSKPTHAWRWLCPSPNSCGVRTPTRLIPTRR